MRKLSAKTDHASRAVLNAASGGLWTKERTSRIYGTDDCCKFCQEAEGSAVHLIFDCPAFNWQRKEAEVRPREEGIPLVCPSLLFGTCFPSPLLTADEPAVPTEDTVPFTDSSGKHPAEPSHRSCGCGIAGDQTGVSYPLPGCWQSVYRAELHAIM
eukprot:2448306-Amphidinium_carterae.1